jgi:hypothetical protein
MQYSVAPQVALPQVSGAVASLPASEEVGSVTVLPQAERKSAPTRTDPSDFMIVGLQVPYRSTPRRIAEKT